MKRASFKTVPIWLHHTIYCKTRPAFFQRYRWTLNITLSCVFYFQSIRKENWYIFGLNENVQHLGIVSDVSTKYFLQIWSGAQAVIKPHPDFIAGPQYFIIPIFKIFCAWKFSDSHFLDLTLTGPDLVLVPSHKASYFYHA